MINLKDFEIWFVTGSQHLYGEETLKEVDRHSKIIAEALGKASEIPVKVIFKPVLKTPEEIRSLCMAANAEEKCVGIVTWMHTFSPSKMWISGLSLLNKPYAHLHTQFNREIPWSTIDMDFMNLNQSAHGDREHGFIGSRMRLDRKIIVGFWEDADVRAKIGTWARAACAWSDSRTAKFARFGDNMREVAVTEGDKVEAQIKFGYSVNGYGVGDLAHAIKSAKDSDVEKVLADYDAKYNMQADCKAGGARREALKVSARIEAGLRAFMEKGNFRGFTTTFEDLYGIEQLPGLAVQRLMEDGYGFGAEGDWKTAALVRAMKVMGAGLKGGTSFMEDYTYHLVVGKEKVLGAHMLEVCPSIADAKPNLEMHPLGIGGKEDPARLVFNVSTGPALNATIVDMGDRFRMIINEVDVVRPDQDMPKLPVARAVWVPKPDFKVGCGAWILAGGAHHSSFSQSVTSECLEDFARIAGIECLVIGKNTSLKEFENEVKWNDLYYRLAKGI